MRFLRFAFLSGIGWLCDIGTYAILVESELASPAVANFVSSFVGVTFVYVTSLRFVFGRARGQAFYFILIYWGYHLLSTLTYSGILRFLVPLMGDGLWALVTPALLAKIVITPFNLLTNYIFMSLLGCYMRADSEK
jgi:putative flippase GtrA